MDQKTVTWLQMLSWPRCEVKYRTFFYVFFLPVQRCLSNMKQPAEERQTGSHNVKLGLM